MRQLTRLSVMFAALVIVPSAAWAQGSITGVATDASGGVLPGVTVEVASPALIEQVRVGVTDGTGQYRIESLRPGTYSVTFTLPGFATVLREGIELTGNFIASVDGELRVGGIEETITVTGESPTVDVQSTTRQMVMDQELLAQIPSGQSVATVTMLLASVTTTSSGADLSGTDGEARFGPDGSNSVRGVDEPRMVLGGLSLHSAQGSGESGGGNFMAFQEVVVDTGGVSVDVAEGGILMELIPREGGNTFSGAFYAAFADESLASNNFTPELAARGLRTPNSIRRFGDLNFAFGGPVAQDKVWFHTAGRFNRASDFGPIFLNLAAGDPNVWTFEESTEPALDEGQWDGFNGRVTWQAAQSHKLAFAVDYQQQCQCPRPNARLALEAADRSQASVKPKVYYFGDWTAPLTSRLLIEAHTMFQHEVATRPRSNTGFTNDPGGVRMIGVTEQTSRLQYRAVQGTSNFTVNETFNTKLIGNYITGAHSVRFGIGHDRSSQDQEQFIIDSPLAYRFRNGVPNRLTMTAAPNFNLSNSSDTALFVRDRWTIDRMTVNVGLRYDFFHSYFPDVTLGPGEFVPNRNITLAGDDGVRWHDLSPRAGLAYDLFGNGRTALTFSINKYLGFHGLSNRGGPFTTAMTPSSRLIRSTNRSWRDANGDFVADCDLLDPAANGECGRMSRPNFGDITSGTAYDPDTTSGWGKRDYNWQFAGGVQQEIASGVSVDVQFFRTWFENHIIIDNRALTAADFDTFSITAPTDPRLPGGGGNVIGGLKTLKPEKFGVRSDRFITFAESFGDMSETIEGVDFNLSARPGPGIVLQGGTSTQRRSWNDCAVRAQVPEALAGIADEPPLDVDPLSLGTPFCDVPGTFRTQFKMFGAYTIPGIDVLFSTMIQSLAGPTVLAEYVATNAVIAPSLGRNLAGGARNQEVQIVAPETMYGPRVNQIDFRVAKILRFGGARATLSLDVFNVFNKNTPQGLNDAFGRWQAPTNIMKARLAKIVAQFDF